LNPGREHDPAIQETLSKFSNFRAANADAEM
jgi:hypothetical protein